MGRGRTSDAAVKTVAHRSKPKCKIMYHVAPVSARDTIAKEGLKPANALTRNPLWRNDPAYKRGDKGVFLFTNRKSAQNWIEYMEVLHRSDYRKGRSDVKTVAYDIYEIEVQGEIQPDDMMAEGHSFLSPEISAEHLKLIH